MQISSLKQHNTSLSQHNTSIPLIHSFAARSLLCFIKLDEISHIHCVLRVQRWINESEHKKRSKLTRKLYINCKQLVNCNFTFQREDGEGWWWERSEQTINEWAVSCEARRCDIKSSWLFFYSTEIFAYKTYSTTPPRYQREMMITMAVKLLPYEPSRSSVIELKKLHKVHLVSLPVLRCIISTPEINNLSSAF